MKKVLAAFSMLVMGQVYAQDLSFGDVNYFIKKGQFNFVVDTTLEARNYKLKSGGTTDTKDREGYYQRARANFGLSDQLNLFVGIGYNHKNRVKSETAPTNESFYENGFINPQVGLNFRAVNQSQALVNVDVGAVASIRIQDEKVGASVGKSSRDGNSANGRNSVEGNVRIGRKWNEANEWQLALGGIYNMSGERDRKQIGAATQNLDLDSSVDAYLRASYQYRPVQEIMFLLSLQGNKISEMEESNSSTKYKYDDHLDFDIAFNVKYLITENFILRGIMQKGNNPSYDYTTNGTKTEVKSRRENVYGLGFDFLF